MFRLSNRSKENREGIDPRLIEIDDLAIKITLVDFGHGPFAGKRTAPVQNGLFLDGRSKADGYDKLSNHQLGKALDFYAAQVIWLANKKKIFQTKKKIKRAIGIEVIAKNEKNKVGLPYRECEFNLIFNYGIDDDAACIKFLKDINSKVPKDITRVKTKTKREWLEIETGFMPTKRKYK